MDKLVFFWLAEAKAVTRCLKILDIWSLALGYIFWIG